MNLHTTHRRLASTVCTTLAAASLPLLALAPATAAPGTLSLVATSADGAAFDLDEYAAGDLTVQVTDSIAGPVDVDDAQDLQLVWRITPFDTAAPVVRLPVTGADVVTDDVAGEFVVPLPAGQEPGSYALFARLVADPGGNNSIPITKILTVATGDAELAFADADPLLTQAGADRPVTGTLALEDGTGLPGRVLDLAFTRGTAGSDPAPDAGLLPELPATSPILARQVTTGADGSFAVVLSDPAEDGQGTELGGSLAADTATTPDVGDAGAGSTLAIDLVGTTAPAGSTLVASDLGAGTPGQALTGTITVTAPDDTYDTDPGTPGVQGDAGTDPDPVEGQLYDLALDHGFFTTGDEELPSVVGDPAGNLVDLGQSLTGVTDADGQVSFAVGIERDRDFDDDGLVTATASSTAGDLSGASVAEWDSTDPLNGGGVAIVRSPKTEQVGPVDPALVGRRTYYDVFTLDQFGNRVAGEPVDLTYAGDLDDWDYSEDFLVSDLDRAGDLWVVSFEAAAIDVTGTWTAPTYTYVDAAGTAATGTDVDLSGSASSEFYELDFDASSFSVKSSAKDVVEVGSTVSETVKVVDQLGNPVRGYQVKFFRFGPDSSDGEPKLTRTTNGRGEATYTFVGTEVGRAKLTATVSDGVNSVTLTDNARFGAAIRVKVSGDGAGKKADQVRVKAQRVAAGAKVRLLRVTRKKTTTVVRGRLDSRGNVTLVAPDRNGRRKTTYVAAVRSTSSTVAATSRKVTVR